MDQIIIYSPPEDEVPYSGPAHDGDLTTSPQIKDVFSRLRDNGNFDSLGNGRLCDVCSKLNLRRSMFDICKRNNNNDDDGDETLTDGHDDGIKEDKIMPLGRLKDVFERNDCALCRLVRWILDEEHKLHTRGAPIDREGRDAAAEVVLVWTCDKGLQEVIHQPAVYGLQVRLTNPNFDGEGNPGVFGTKLLMEPFTPPEKEDPALLMGRVYGGGPIDVGLLKTWMQCCEEWHTGECKTSFRVKLAHPAAEFTLYAIDVHNMQLKMLAKGDRYCALSYVWGLRPFYRLLAQELPEFLDIPGSITSRIMDRLPQTIVGAIGLVRDLGVPYLWVDSICIPQDNEAYKKAVIGKMHLVYGKAEFTIVAASGPDSFYGLPGYGCVPRDVPQFARRVGNVGNSEDLVLGVRHRYQWSLAMSPHGQRGWTYQEMCFSTRCLVFLNGTVYFQCRQALWREDWALEHPTAVKFFLHEMDNRLMQNTDLLSQYRHSLREYTRRKLTYQHDAVNAFAGVMEAQRALFSPLPLGPVCCGLHLGLIDWVILFYLGHGARRRLGFPSWSWAGWVGEAFLPYPLFGSIQKLILWEMEHCPSRITYFEDLGFVGMPDIKHVLRVETLAATLLLDPKTLDGPGIRHPLWRLRDWRGRLCGFVSLHDLTFCGAALRSAEAGGAMLDVKVLILSDKVPGQGLYPYMGSHISYDPESRDEEELPPGVKRWQVVPFTGHEGKVRAEFGNEPLDQYNVLIVAPRGAPLGGEGGSGLRFYDRIGVGVIHNQALSWAVDDAPSWKEFLIL